MPYDVESELGFLARDALYDTVKPYSLRFTPPDGSPRHNLQSELTKVTIRDARPLNPTIEKHGFTLTRVPTKMRNDDFREHDKIERVYAPELQAHLKSLFQARHVRVIDYVVRALQVHIRGRGLTLSNRFDAATPTSPSRRERITTASNLPRWYILVGNPPTIPPTSFPLHRKLRRI